MARGGAQSSGGGRWAAIGRSAELRIVAVAVVAVLVAQLAVLLIGSSVPEPDRVAVDRHFGAEQVERAREYRGALYLMGVAAIGVTVLALGVVAAGRPRRARRALARLGTRPLLGACAVGAILSLLVSLVTLPLGLIVHGRAVEFGISTQSTLAWIGDRALAATIAATTAAIGAGLLIAIQRRLPRLWWAAGSGVLVAYAVLITWLAPVVIAPLFNRFEPLPPSQARGDVRELAERAGVDFGEILVVDASRRVTRLNAYVDGIGSTRRIVLYDNLLDAAERPALRSLVAHELAHVANRDILRGLLFVALVAPLGMLLVKLVGDRLAERGGTRSGTPAALPGYAFALVAVAIVLGVPGNQLSRAIEAEADRFALELTDDPRGFIDLRKQVAERNLSDPDPPGWVVWLMGSHPTPVERIGAAEAFARESGRR